MRGVPKAAAEVSQPDQDGILGAGVLDAFHKITSAHAALCEIARPARRHDVGPVVQPALASRVHMISGAGPHGHRFEAVFTFPTLGGQGIRAGNAQPDMTGNSR